MTRSARITGALVALALLLAAGGLALPARAGGTPTPTTGLPSRAGTSAVMPFVIPLPPGAWAIVPLDGQEVPTGEWSYDGEAGQYSVSFWQWIATATPLATPVDATDTPTVTPSATPTLTQTSTPTKPPTSQPSATPTASNTPSATPLPTNTPTPTATATASLTATPAATLECYGEVVATGTLNVRSEHATSGAILGKTSAGARWQVYEIWPESDAPYANEWARVRLTDGRTAWIASYYGRETYLRLDSSDDCSLVQFGPGKDEPTSTPRPTSTPAPQGTPVPSATVGPFPTPTVETAIGIWSGVGTNRTMLDQFVSASYANGQQPSAVVYGDCETMAALKSRGVLVIARGNWPDAPDLRLAPEVGAELHVNRVMSQVGNCAWDYVVLTNEVTDWPDSTYRAKWIYAAHAQMQLWGGRKAIPFVEAPGHFWLNDIQELTPILTLMAGWQWPLGINLYPADGSSQTTSICEKTPWTDYTTYRPLLYADKLPDGLQIVVTELGNGWGNYPVSASDVACFLKRSPNVYTSVNVWYTSGSAMGHWPLALLGWGAVVEIGNCCR